MLDKLLEGLKKDGTHPDFPIKKNLRGLIPGRIPWSELAFEVPALVVYDLGQGGRTPEVGVVISLSHSIDGTGIQVMSRHNGEIICHPVDRSPSGGTPHYLLLKKHIPMTNVP